MKKKFKNFLWIAISLCLIASFFSCSSNKATSKDSIPLSMNSDIVSGTLENGMDYYVQQNSNPENRIQLRLVVNAGSLMEDDDQLGVAHLVEHMAFNGSENFSKNEIIEFFESTGMAFGHDLNAYTSFEQTVYMLEIPADNPEFLEKAMLILKDWASGLTFVQEELDKERGVVTEEWRLSNENLNGRISNAEYPALLGGSLFAERLPIGKMDIIQNIDRQRVVDFYEKWYRPDLMSVIVVGDISSEEVEKAIINTMGEIPAATEPLEMPDNTFTKDEKSLLIFKDKEQPYTIVSIYDFSPAFPLITQADYKEQLTNQILLYILNNRIQELVQSDNPPFIDGAAISQKLLNSNYLNGLLFACYDNQIESGIKVLLDEVARIQTFGVTDSEVERMRQSILASLHDDSKNESYYLVEILTDYCITGTIPLSPAEEEAIVEIAVNSITTEDVSKAAKNVIANRGVFLEVRGNENAVFPSEETLMDIWENYKNDEITAYEDTSADADWLIIPENKAKITSKEVVSKADGITKYVLENGATVYAKKTDYTDDKISFTFLSPGGLSLVSDEEYVSGAFATDYSALSGLNGVSYMDLQKLLADKDISYSCYIDQYEEGFSGTVKSSDLETMLQLTYLTFEKPYFTDTMWNYLYTNASTMAQASETQPTGIFSQALLKALYKDDIRKQVMTTDYVAKANKEDAARIFTERFANPSDFIFVFAGDYEESDLENLISTYIGTISGEDVTETPIWQEPDFPAGKQEIIIEKGIGNQSQVALIFGGELKNLSPMEEKIRGNLLNSFVYLLDIKLREAIREDKGGSYGVSVYYDMNRIPEDNFYIEIGFGCEPGREEELVDELFKQIKLLQTELVDQSYVAKLSENYKRGMEKEVLKDNELWADRIATCVLYDLPFEVITDATTVPPYLTAEAMKDLANQYLDLENYVLGILKPESTGN